MRADINECFLLEFHKKNGSGIVNCSKLLHRIQVIHHDDGEAPHVNWKSCGIETFLNPQDQGPYQYHGHLE